VNKQKLPIEQLMPGMYVCEVDRPWLETPFLMQGFRIRNEQDIAKIASVCKYVYVDTDKSAVKRVFKPQGQAGANDPNRIQRTFRSPLPYQRPFENEIAYAQDLQRRAKQAVGQLFDSVRLGNDIRAREIKGFITDMVKSVVRNPDALMLLSNLQDKDEFAATHAMNVCILSVTLGRHIGMLESELNELGIGAILHDVGEVAIPSEVLAKGTNLSPEEFELFKTHPMEGVKILEKTRGIPLGAIDIARSHHERMNGSGYPRGLDASRIPPLAMIVAIADVYDTVTHVRSGYALTSVEALKNMYNWRDHLLDADLVEQFIQCIGIYPLGSIVELDSGEVGIVISVDPSKRLLPRVMLVRDADKNPYPTPRIIDLSRGHQGGTGNILTIVRVHQPGAFGIDLKNYLLREMGISKMLGPSR